MADEIVASEGPSLDEWWTPESLQGKSKDEIVDLAVALVARLKESPFSPVLDYAIEAGENLIRELRAEIEDTKGGAK
jgi:hypothetical protein